MPDSYTNLLYHVVFSTKDRRPLITPEYEPRLYDYIGGIVRSVFHRDRDPRRTRDDVRVGYDRAIRAHYESGAKSRGGALARATAKELLEYISRYLLDDLRLDSHDRRSDARDSIGYRRSTRRIDGAGGSLRY